MAYHNPLFVDSTRVKGERIIASVELNGLLLYPGDVVGVRIVEAEHGEQSWRLEMSEAGPMVGEVWLTHQSPFFFQFEIRTWDGRRYESRWNHSTGSYGLLEVWEPHLEMQKKPIFKNEEIEIKNIRSEARIDSVTRPLREGFSNLIALWDL